MGYIKDWKMKFPIFNLSYPYWKENLIQEFVRHDQFYYSNDNEFFEKYFLGQTFVDSEGQLFVLKKAKEEVGSKFILLKKDRKKLYFKALNKELTFEELKSELLQRVDTLELDAVKHEFYGLLKSAKNTEDLLSEI